MIPTGKGVYIWRLPDCGHGSDMTALAATLQAAGIKWVSVKIHNGTSTSWDPQHSALLTSFFAACKFYGISVRGWGYCYGFSISHAIAEASLAANLVILYALDGYDIDAEHEWKSIPNKVVVAQEWCKKFRSFHPNFSLSLSTYRYPTIHWDFPFTGFFPYINFVMPQMYWEQAHNPDQQLQWSYDDYKDYAPYLPYVPAGSVYCWGGWCATTSDLQKFHDKAKALNLPGISAWSLQHMITGVQKPLWDLYKTLDWGPVTPPPPDPVTPPPIIPVLPKAKVLPGVTVKIRWTPSAPADNSNWTKQVLSSEDIVPVSAYFIEPGTSNEWFGIQSKTNVRGWSAKKHNGVTYMEWVK